MPRSMKIPYMGYCNPRSTVKHPAKGKQKLELQWSIECKTRWLGHNIVFT